MFNCFPVSAFRVLFAWAPLFLLLCAPMVEAREIRFKKIADGLDEPWSLAFLPDGFFLVSERDSRQLLLFSPSGTRVSVKGLPEIARIGQGGLLDVLVPKDFGQTRQIFLSYAIRQSKGAGTAIGVGTLSADGRRLQNFKTIFEMSAGSRGKVHFGGRLAERDDMLFLTIGERGERPAAQDLARHNGTIVRIYKDGTVPADNPFVGQANRLPEIWSYGHRNPQGLTLDLNGQLWTVEHGARGGDEINRIEKGGNYGWPVIAYGTHYSGAKIGEGTSKPGLLQPEFYWDPSMAPSGFMIYSGKLWPEWTGQMFIGSLKFDMISRLSANGTEELERLQSAETQRVRDIREAPDGSIWFLSVDHGAIYRMSPD